MDEGSGDRVMAKPRPVWLVVRGWLPSISLDLGLIATGAQGLLIVMSVWAGMTNHLLNAFTIGCPFAVAFYSSVLGLLLAGVSLPTNARERRDHAMGVVLCAVGLLLCIYPVGAIFLPG